jgi:hypothetical protein
MKIAIRFFHSHRGFSPVTMRLLFTELEPFQTVSNFVDGHKALKPLKRFRCTGNVPSPG